MRVPKDQNPPISSYKFSQYQMTMTNKSVWNSRIKKIKRKENRSPKGNIWSTIPVALLWVIVNWSEGSRAAAPKGTKSCRTQGDFRSSCQKKWMRCYRGLTEGLPEPKQRSKRADVRPYDANWKLERAGLKLERTEAWIEALDSWLKAWEARFEAWELKFKARIT